MPQTRPRDSRYTASTGLTWLLLAHLRTRGVDVRALVTGAGLRLSELMGPDARIPLGQLHALYRGAVETTGDEALGIRLLQSIDPQSTFSWPAPFSLQEHLARMSSTLREGLERQARFVRLLRDGETIAFEHTPFGLLSRFEFAVEDEPHALIDFHMASGVLLVRRVMNDATVAPIEVRFARGAPKDASVYEAYFRAPVRFDADDNAILSNVEGLERPLPSHNPLMIEVLEHRAKKIIDNLPAIDDFVGLVRERIEAELPGGNTNASWVAEKLGISQRTLHRRLQAEGTSYQDLLDKVRCRLATRYLSLRKHSINEVAGLVGFAQPSAFHRAFKSWTGETPADYQERFAGAVVGPSAPPSRRAT